MECSATCHSANLESLFAHGFRNLASSRVVAHAVIVERVREPKFPANRGNYRKFCRIVPLDAILCADK